MSTTEGFLIIINGILVGWLMVLYSWRFRHTIRTESDKAADYGRGYDAGRAATEAMFKAGPGDVVKVPPYAVHKRPDFGPGYIPDTSEGLTAMVKSIIKRIDERDVRDGNDFKSLCNLIDVNTKRVDAIRRRLRDSEYLKTAVDTLVRDCNSMGRQQRRCSDEVATMRCELTAVQKHLMEAELRKAAQERGEIKP